MILTAGLSEFYHGYLVRETVSLIVYSLYVASVISVLLLGYRQLGVFVSLFIKGLTSLKDILFLASFLAKNEAWGLIIRE